MNLSQKLSEIYKKHTLGIVVGFIIVIMFLLALQGFDVVDEGWYMTFYQHFFNHPETVEYNFAFYLTGIVGGLWYALFPQGGILSFRILAMLCIVMTFVFSYKILIKYISKSVVVIGLLMVLFVNDFGYLAFYYNHLSSLLAVLTILFLLKGLSKNNLSFIVIAGCLTAINVFSRLPNITLFAFSLVFPAQFLWNKTLSFKYWFKQAIYYVFGALLGFVIMYLVLVSLGHLDIMHNAIIGILDKGKNTGSNHNFSRLLSVYVKDYVLVIKMFLKIIVAFVILISTRKLLFRYRFSKFIWYILGIVLFVLVFRVYTIYSLYAFSLFGCMSLLLMKKVKLNYKVLSLLALIMMLFLPLGSDGGIHNVGYVSVWVALPLFLYVLEINFNWEVKNLSFNKLGLTKVLPVMITSFFLLKAYKISNESYFDLGNRFHKTYPINNDLAKGVFTTKKRAQIFNELLPVLKQYVNKNDYLLAYDKIPMINFLTETKPYMFNSWVWVYDGVMFKKQLDRAEEEIGILPIVVQQKFETIVAFSEPILDYMSEDKEENYRYNKGRVIAMNNFLQRNNYEIVWSNTHFNIYKPKSTN